MNRKPLDKTTRPYQIDRILLPHKNLCHLTGKHYVKRPAQRRDRGTMPLSGMMSAGHAWTRFDKELEKIVLRYFTNHYKY